MKEPTAFISGDDVVMSRGNWSTRFPIEDLPTQLAFYRRLRDRRAGQFASTYAPDVRVLEALQAERRARDAQ